MRLKSGLKIEEIDGRYIAIGGENSDFNGMIAMNETGKFIAELLYSEISKEEIVEKICDEYEVGKTRAGEDLERFLKILSDADLIDYEN